MRVELSSQETTVAGAPARSRQSWTSVKRLPKGSIKAARSGPPWWLWPHLLSLDAPLVALAWQDWWHRIDGTPLSAGERTILGAGVWMIYLADRVADTTRGWPDDPRTARHGFAGVWRGPLLVLVASIGTGLVILAPCSLRTGQFFAGLPLLAAAAIYFWLIHRPGSQRWMEMLPKEAVVGGMFALGTAFFAFCRLAMPPWPFLAAVVLFGIVCFLNCALITSWERNACDLRNPFSFLNAFPSLVARGLRPACWMIAGIAAGAGMVMQAWGFLPVALAAFSLGILDRWQHRISPNALRTLADAVLLTPWICCGAVAMTSYFTR